MNIDGKKKRRVVRLLWLGQMIEKDYKYFELLKLMQRWHRTCWRQDQ